MEALIVSIDYIKNIVENVARQYGVKKVFLFGSYAKNNATTNSDIDLLIEKGKPMSLLDLSGMRMQFEDRLKIPVDLVTTDGIKGELSEDILKTEVLLYEE